MDGHDRLPKQGYLRCEAPGIGCEWVNSLNGKEYPESVNGVRNAYKKKDTVQCLFAPPEGLEPSTP